MQVVIQKSDYEKMERHPQLMRNRSQGERRFLREDNFWDLQVDDTKMMRKTFFFSSSENQKRRPSSSGS